MRLGGRANAPQPAQATEASQLGPLRVPAPTVDWNLGHIFGRVSCLMDGFPQYFEYSHALPEAVSRGDGFRKSGFRKPC